MLELHEFESQYFSGSHIDLAYLNAHFPRFLETKRLFDMTCDPAKRQRVLDVGAHWLHQSLLWRDAGHSVVAADIPATLALADVKALADRNQISLVVYDRLDTGAALASIPDSSIDVVLFCEILEHITFNPIAFWGEVYRVLAPKGRIVVTTPNYYWIKGRAWDPARLLRRCGSGLSVTEILRTPTYGPHWKEFSLREVVAYFQMISNDFVVVKAEYVSDPRDKVLPRNWLDRSITFVESLHRVFYWGLHVEIELKSKESGIAVTPQW